MPEPLATAFTQPEAVARYAEGPVRLVPGFHHLQRMTELLLAESVKDDGRILVLGAGGGLELKVFAESHPGWRFDGVDPSAEMLALAQQTLGPLNGQITLHEGYIDTAPTGPFDGATCLLTLHFIPKEERLRTLTEIHNRLAPGAPFVSAHHSFPPQEKTVWLSRYAAFAIAFGVPEADAKNAATAISERLPTLSPEEDEALLAEAGFSNIRQFYAAFTFKGWVAQA